MCCHDSMGIMVSQEIGHVAECFAENLLSCLPIFGRLHIVNDEIVKHWYVLRVKPHKERAVANYLQLREVTFYAPFIKVKPVNPRAAKQRPYFPGYLFVQANLDVEGQQAFSWIPGSRGLVRFGEEAAIVPANLIHEVQQQLAQLNAQGGVEQTAFRKGERVKVVSGPFAGYEAIFDMHLSDNERIQVLMRFLSEYPQPTKLNITEIQKINKK